MAIFKKSTRKSLPHETSGIEKFFRGLLISVIALVILGGFWFLSQLGPKDIDFRDFNYNIEVLDSIKAIQQESIDLEEQFEEGGRAWRCNLATEGFKCMLQGFNCC